MDNLDEFDKKIDEFLHMYNIGENPETDEEPEPTDEPTIIEEPKKFIEEFRENTKNYKQLESEKQIERFKKIAREQSLKGESSCIFSIPYFFYDDFVNWLTNEEFTTMEQNTRNESARKLKIMW